MIILHTYQQAIIRPRKGTFAKITTPPFGRLLHAFMVDGKKKKTSENKLEFDLKL